MSDNGYDRYERPQYRLPNPGQPGSFPDGRSALYNEALDIFKTKSIPELFPNESPDEQARISAAYAAQKTMYVDRSKFASIAGPDGELTFTEIEGYLNSSDSDRNDERGTTQYAMQLLKDSFGLLDDRSLWEKMIQKAPYVTYHYLIEDISSGGRFGEEAQKIYAKREELAEKK